MGNFKIIFGTFLFVGFGLLDTERAAAQKLEIGFRLMPTLSQFDLKTSEGGTVKGEAKFGFGAGGLLAFSYYILDRTHVRSNALYAGLSFLF